MRDCGIVRLEGAQDLHVHVFERRRYELSEYIPVDDRPLNISPNMLESIVLEQLNRYNG